MIKEGDFVTFHSNLWFLTVGKLMRGKRGLHMFREMRKNIAGKTWGVCEVHHKSKSFKVRGSLFWYSPWMVKTVYKG